MGLETKQQRTSQHFAWCKLSLKLWPARWWELIYDSNCVETVKVQWLRYRHKISWVLSHGVFYNVLPFLQCPNRNHANHPPWQLPPATNQCSRLEASPSPEATDPGRCCFFSDMHAHVHTYVWRYPGRKTDTVRKICAHTGSNFRNQKPNSPPARRAQIYSWWHPPVTLRSAQTNAAELHGIFFQACKSLSVPMHSTESILTSARIQPLGQMCLWTDV